jgi:hypothetical protein
VPEPHSLRRHRRRARKAGGESRLQSAAVTRKLCCRRCSTPDNASQKATAPDGDVLPHLVAILADTISQVEGPAKTAVMTRLLGRLTRNAAQPLYSCS